MISKTIHYCWFGGNPLPKLTVKCIESWKKYCPEYEIKEWNEGNFDVSCCDYVYEAYKSKKWAFVSDYARFDILYKYGGIYFDTDVELIRPIDDILDAGPFMGFEYAEAKNKKNVASGLGLAANPGLGLAADPGLGLVKEILDEYKKKHFIREDGSYDLTTIVYYTMEILKKYGLNESSGFQRQNIGTVQYVAGFYIYPPDYFCPINYLTGDIQITGNTRSIHHYTASWQNNLEKKISTISKKYMKYGTKGKTLSMILSMPYRFKNKLDILGYKGMMRFIACRLKAAFCGRK